MKNEIESNFSNSYIFNEKDIPNTYLISLTGLRQPLYNQKQ